MPPAQRRLDLLCEQAYWTADGPVYRVLAEIPLPGASTGRPTYLLYLRITSHPDQTAGAPAAEVRGLLIQTRGRQAGLTPVAKATVSGPPPPPAGHAAWMLHVDLAFEDGSHLSGDLLAAREDWMLMRFETRTHTADVQALLKAAG